MNSNKEKSSYVSIPSLKKQGQKVINKLSKGGKTKSKRRRFSPDKFANQNRMNT